MPQIPMSPAERADALENEQVENILQYYSTHPYDEHTIHGDKTLGVTVKQWLGEVVRTANTRGIQIPELF